MLPFLSSIQQGDVFMKKEKLLAAQSPMAPRAALLGL
jgi:hypothetical protein